MMTKKILAGLGIGAMLLGMGSTVWAGQKTTSPVYITSTFFGGSLGSTRNSTNTTDYIGCWLYHASVSCSARQGATIKTCSTTHTGHVAAARTMDSDSYLAVEYSGGTCTAIRVGKYSYYDIAVR